jgi:hypothetical protein
MLNEAASATKMAPTVFLPSKIIRKKINSSLAGFQAV